MTSVCEGCDRPLRKTVCICCGDTTLWCEHYPSTSGMKQGRMNGLCNFCAIERAYSKEGKTCLSSHKGGAKEIFIQKSTE